METVISISAPSLKLMLARAPLLSTALTRGNQKKCLMSKLECRSIRRL